MFELARFNEALLKKASTLTLGSSPNLREAIAYAISGPGKRIRPQFVMESAHLVKLNPASAELIAISIELGHLFSLVHDDLPCLDNDDSRRGIPTVHKKFNEPLALLAGDALLNLSFQVFGELLDFHERDIFKIGFQYYSNAIGALGMMGGQCLELKLGTTPSLTDLIHVQKLKTGALFDASLVLPALFMGYKHESQEVQDLKEYAEHFGFAFQVADDLEDESQDQSQGARNILSYLTKIEAIQQAVSKLSSAKLIQRFEASDLILKKLKKS